MTTFATEDTALALDPIEVPDPQPTNAEAWAAFHQQNPHVYTTLVRLLEQDLAAGFTYVSLKYHVEALRREGVRTTGRPYRFPNAHTAFYAHLIADERPDLAPLLRLQKQRAA